MPTDKSENSQTTGTVIQVPQIDHKLKGQENYAEWILSIEMGLSMYMIGANSTVWDIVIGNVTEIATSGKEKDDQNKEVLEKSDWTKYNFFAIITMKNTEPEVVTRFGLCRLASEAYGILRSLYEGKTLTDLGAILANVTKLEFDDRKSTIDEHINEYEKRWGFMNSTLAGSEFFDKQKGFGDGLKQIASNDAAKAKFLPLTMPTYYSSLVENIRTKTEYGYGDVVRQLQLYVPMRQKGKKTGKGTQKDPVVLETEADNGKRCEYCIKVKKWKGLNHTEDECRTKKQRRLKQQTPPKIPNL